MIGDIIVRFFHLLATVTWVGGMIYFAFIAAPTLASEQAVGGKLIGAMSKRFTPIAWICIAVLIVTGLLMTSTSMLFDFSSSYGVALSLKHLAILVMIVVGVAITFFIAPKVENLAPTPEQKPTPEFFKAQKLLNLLAHVNLVLGILVLLFTAIS